MQLAKIEDRNENQFSCLQWNRNFWKRVDFGVTKIATFEWERRIDIVAHNETINFGKNAFSCTQCNNKFTKRSENVNLFCLPQIWLNDKCLSILIPWFFSIYHFSLAWLFQYQPLWGRLLVSFHDTYWNVSQLNFLVFL